MEIPRHQVYLTGVDEQGKPYVQEVYPQKKLLSEAVRGKNAELIIAAADANLLSYNYIESAESIQCEVFDKKGNNIGKTKRRSPIYQNVAQDVAELIQKTSVTIVIR